MKRFFLLCALLAAAPVGAQTPVRVNPAQAPSCAPTEAACAVAQFFFCAASQDTQACAELGLGEIPRIVETPQPVEFLIERVGKIEATDITDDLKHLAWYRAGHLLVEALVRRCPTVGNCADESWDDWQIYLRPEDDHLRIVFWRGDSEPDQPPDIPDNFRAPTPPSPPTVE
jgi:hypothetical protein